MVVLGWRGGGLGIISATLRKNPMKKSVWFFTYRNFQPKNGPL